MSKLNQMDEYQCNDLIEELWNQDSNCERWFPKKVYEWIQQHSVILGVPEVYIAYPLLVAIAHLSQHA